MIKVRIKKLPQARTGYQVQGALVNDVPAMGGADYNAYIGKPKLKESKYIKAVPRSEAKIEAEGGETVYGDLNGDGMPEHKIISGPRHAQGGVPLNLPEDTFIFSDTRGMRIKDPVILNMFGKGGTDKSYTPAELAKQYDIQKYRVILEDPETDMIERKTAELMIKKYVIKLGCLALAQESMKGFPQGIPAVAKPCMDAQGITEEQLIPKEIATLDKQLDAKIQAEQQQSQQSEIQEAEELNDGMPVAQATQEQQPQEMPASMEEMMMYGGNYRRRLRRAEEGMQQPSPEEMAMMQQEGSEGGMEEILQQVQSALQQGVEPQEIVVSLLQNNLPPEAIVQIFTQLGVSQEQAVGIIQEVIQQMQGGQQQQMAQQPMSEEEAMMMQQQQMQQQAPPMAMYGMSMGGYDMPFYDDYMYEEEVPEAAYGMQMGSGSMFPLPKAGNGIEVDATGMTEDQIRRAVYDAQQKNPGEKIIVINRGGSGKREVFQNYKYNIDEGKNLTKQQLDDIEYPDTDEGRIAAAQYYLIKKNLEDENVRKEIIKNTKEALNNPNAWQGKNSYKRGEAADPNKTYDKLYPSNPLDDDEIIKLALKHQQRNLLFQAKGIDPQLFSDVGNELRTASKIVASGAKDPAGNPYTITTAQAALNKLKDIVPGIDQAGHGNIAWVSEAIGIPLDNSGRERVIQQGTMHGYAKAHKNYNDKAYDSNPDLKYAMMNFLGDVAIAPVGANDEASMTNLYGAIGSQISPLDDTYDYDNHNWYNMGTKGGYTTYGNTNTGHRMIVKQTGMSFVDEQGCQCTDPSNAATYGKMDPNTKKCNPELCKEDPKVCECDDIVLEPNADGSCPPCDEEVEYPVEGPPAQWWLQDTIKTTGAFADLMNANKYMPYVPGVDLETPRPNFLDPTRDLASIKEDSSMQDQAIAQFSSAQQARANVSGAQGQRSKRAADILSKFNNANANIGNQFEMKATDIRNQEQMLNQAAATKEYDGTTIANQQFDNTKLALKNNLRNYFTNAITNKYKTDALNQMYPNMAVAAGVGGKMYYRPTDKKFTGQQSGKEDYFKLRQKCIDNGVPPEKVDDCARNAGNYEKQTTTVKSQPDINNFYPLTRDGGSVFENGGYVYIDSWFPFIM